MRLLDENRLCVLLRFRVCLVQQKTLQALRVLATNKIPNIPQCTLPPCPVYQTLLFDFLRVWLQDYLVYCLRSSLALFLVPPPPPAVSDHLQCAKTEISFLRLDSKMSGVQDNSCIYKNMTVCIVVKLGFLHTAQDHMVLPYMEFCVYKFMKVETNTASELLW